MAELTVQDMAGETVTMISVKPSTTMSFLKSAIQNVRPDQYVKKILVGERLLDRDKTVEEVGIASGGTVQVVFAPFVKVDFEKFPYTVRVFPPVAMPAKPEEFVDMVKGMVKDLFPEGPCTDVPVDVSSLVCEEIDVSELVKTLTETRFKDALATKTDARSELLALLAEADTSWKVTCTEFIEDMGDSGKHVHVFYFVECHIIILDHSFWYDINSDND